MSKADKSAQRSTLKANLFRGPIAKSPAVKSSWWIVGAAPSDRERFIEAAHQRAAHVWTNVAPHAMSPRGNFQ